MLTWWGGGIKSAEPGGPVGSIAAPVLVMRYAVRVEVLDRAARWAEVCF